MATTSRALAPGRAPAGHGGKHIGQWMAMLVAIAVLGLTLLIGAVVSQGQRAAEPIVAPVDSGVSVAGRPVDASTSTQFRWDFGQGREGMRPQDASVSAEFRWGYGTGGVASLAGETPCPLGGTAPCGFSGQLGTSAPSHGDGPANEYLR